MQRSASEIVGQEIEGPMIVIDEAYLTPNMETIHSMDSQKTLLLETQQNENDENKDMRLSSLYQKGEDKTSQCMKF